MLFQGALGKSAGLEFNSFIEIQKDIITYDEILAAPSSCRIPSEPSTQWALVGMMVKQAVAGDIAKLMRFVERLSIEFQVIFVKDLNKKDKSLFRTSPEIQAWISHNASRFA
jgi:hypothetical protein